MTYTTVSEQRSSEAASEFGYQKGMQVPCKFEECERPSWGMSFGSSCHPRQPSNMQISNSSSFLQPVAWNDSICSLKSASFTDSNMSCSGEDLAFSQQKMSASTSIRGTPSPMHSSTQSIVPPDMMLQDPFFASQGLVGVEQPSCIEDLGNVQPYSSSVDETDRPHLAVGARDSMRKSPQLVLPGLLASDECDESNCEQSPPLLHKLSHDSAASVMSYNSTPINSSPMPPASGSQTPNPALLNLGYSMSYHPQSQNCLMVPAPVQATRSEMLLGPTGYYCLTDQGYQQMYAPVAPVKTLRSQSSPLTHAVEEESSPPSVSRNSSCSLNQQFQNAQPNLVSLQYPVYTALMSTPAVQTPVLTNIESCAPAAQSHPPVTCQTHCVPQISHHQLMRGSLPASPYISNSPQPLAPITWSNTPTIYSPQIEQQSPLSNISPSSSPHAHHELWDTVANLETRSIARHQGSYGPVNIYQVVDPNNTNSPAVCSIIDFYSADGDYVASKYEPKTADKDRTNPNVILVACTRADEPFAVHFDTEEERNKCLKSMERKYNLANMTEFYPAFQAVVKTDKQERKRRYDYIETDYKRWCPTRGNEKKEIMIKNLHPNAKIKDVKNVFNEMGEVKHVAMPMNKETEEYEAFSCWKDNVDNDSEPKPDRVPNGRACYIVFKNMESAIRALTICHHPNLAHKFGALQITWSNDCSSRRRKQGRNRRNMLINNSYQHK